MSPNRSNNVTRNAPARNPFDDSDEPTFQRTASIPNYPAPPIPPHLDDNSSKYTSSNPFKPKSISTSSFVEKEGKIESDVDNIEIGINSDAEKFSFGSKKPHNNYKSANNRDDLVVEEGKLEQLQELDDLEKDDNYDNDLPHNYKQVILSLYVINLTLMLMLSSTGAAAIKIVDQINDTGVIFIGLYMILFSIIFMVFETFVILYRVQRVAIFYKKNFGFFQGPLGRSAFLVFSGFLSFGLAQPRDLALATGFLVVIWGITYAVVSLKWPQYFLKGNKIVPR
jgi:hypothetical protein